MTDAARGAGRREMSAHVEKRCLRDACARAKLQQQGLGAWVPACLVLPYTCTCDLYLSCIHALSWSLPCDLYIPCACLCDMHAHLRRPLRVSVSLHRVNLARPRRLETHISDEEIRCTSRDEACKAMPPYSPVHHVHVAFGMCVCECAWVGGGARSADLGGRSDSQKRAQRARRACMLCLPHVVRAPSGCSLHCARSQRRVLVAPCARGGATPAQPQSKKLNRARRLHCWDALATASSTRTLCKQSLLQMWLMG